ncbi:hypothetical protein GCM10023149_19340 [Mucilaginibacter gynuensis]|uniref:CAAX prenyl protease 2/Lysostaphin resistance protein A-like domain-containing protein n=1 Tax=Mucilaginibacter gynuensis TaxID=1302236 RepID=A0ABP8G9Y9_9SPHI
MSFIDLLRLVPRTLGSYFRNNHFVIMFSAFLLLMIYGYHGNFDLLRFIIPKWTIPGENVCCRAPIIPGLAWDRELISFIGGAILLVVVPIVLIRLLFKEPLSKYGLGLPEKGKRWTGVFIFLFLVAVLGPGFYMISGDSSMQGVYPFYKPFTSVSEFVWYELAYFPFFITIEFIFRGYILFGLADMHDTYVRENPQRNNYFIGFGLIIQMLAYTMWHMGKPLPELWGTPVWGLVTGIFTYHLRSIWPVTLAHWGLNIFLDAMILHRLHILF